MPVKRALRAIATFPTIFFRFLWFYGVFISIQFVESLIFKNILLTVHILNEIPLRFFFFNDILENGSDSPWLDWFKIENWPLSAYDGTKPANYISWVGNRALPQFNHDNPQVKEYIMQVAEYWLKKGIDGWRLDVPNEVETPGFWQEFRDRVKKIFRCFVPRKM